jgi:hypothetical protein
MDLGAGLRFNLLSAIDTASNRRGKQHDPDLHLGLSPLGCFPVPILSSFRFVRYSSTIDEPARLRRRL